MYTDFSQIGFLLAVITVVVLLLVLLLVNLMLTGRNSRLKHQSELQQLQSETREAISLVRAEVAEATLGDVSRDLHDEVGQLLTFSILQLENTTSKPLEQQELLIAEVKKSVRDAMEAIRRISRGLNPDFINQQGLVKSVEQLLERAHSRTGVSTKINTDPNFTLDTSLNQVVVFRILRECLTNSLKHGKASEITVSLSNLLKSTEISFFDNGVGTSKFPDAIPSLGWKNIQHYASLIQGKVIFNSSPENGTEIILSIPNNKI